MRVRTTWAALLLGAAAVAGCSGDRRVGVEGEVTYDGAPLPLGSIEFLPADGKGVKAGDRVENGRYRIEAKFGPMPGPHQVKIHWLKPTGQKYKNEFGEVFDRTQEGLPDKYHKDTTLTAEIKSRGNVIDFHLAK